MNNHFDRDVNINHNTVKQCLYSYSAKKLNKLLNNIQFKGLVKMSTLLLVFIFINSQHTYAQNYTNLLNYYNNGSPAYGVKIKTNMPFLPGSHGPTISIVGYSYGTNDPINLTLNYYLWSTSGADFSNPANYFVYWSRVSSSGNYTPNIYLSNENGKVIIYIDDRAYFQRFTVSVFSTGEAEQPAWFAGWSTADEALSGTKTVTVPYANKFKGEVSMPCGIWNAAGNVGIGTATPSEKLSVNGNIRAKEVKVETVNWPDYVFQPNYELLKLSDVKAYIDQYHHLPDLPSAAQVEKDGISLGEINAKLLRKIEELTLHLIEKDVEIKVQYTALKELEIRSQVQEQDLKTIKEVLEEIIRKVK